MIQFKYTLPNVSTKEGSQITKDLKTSLFYNKRKNYVIRISKQYIINLI